MDAYLQLSPENQRAACLEGGTRRSLPAASMEKDFWVCWTLRELFSLPDIGPRLTFKGGTSLSKCYGLIERFSEDIDLVIDRATFDGKPPDEKQLASRKELVTNQAVAELATQMYYDPAKQTFWRGAGSDVKGAARRLAALLNQLDLTWYLYGMSGQEILRLLPKEFDRFRHRA